MNIPTAEHLARLQVAEIVALSAFSKADLEKPLPSTRKVEEQTW